jgi:chemotaxis protein MotB
VSHKSPRRRAGHEEEHENHERWLVSYADMITVLMALFIVLFAMSQVDEQKYEALKEGLAVGFGREDSILNGASPVSNAKGVDDPGETTDRVILKEVPEEQRAVVRQILEETARLRRQSQYSSARAEVDRLLEIWKKLDRQLRKRGLREDVRATIDERGLVVSLVSEHVVFRADLADLTARGRRVVDTLAPVLAGLTEPIETDGHTTQEKVKPKYFPTDWELSLARAAHVLRRLEEVHGVPARRLRATGFGHTKPLIDPARHRARKINKRVDIVVLSQSPAETRALMGEAFEEVRRHAGLDEPPVAQPAQPGAAGTTTDHPSAASRPTPKEDLP